ncbi:MAG: UvrD-helicase domain-containing protein [Bacteroidales bacterium]|jgi:ATP-dependent exoDNAse (exonuclease V) beta subunit|nr:UvrD-helicase domain-containing protein [Bacteroidales bacterium]
MSKLLVYSASAGAGKTHQITGHYILMLFSKNKAHRNILAVTFTNKASEEMKNRIISDLAEIIYGNNTERLQEISSYTNLSFPLIKQRAEQIFREILHDYSFFSVSTIDSFFQKILRSFTREIGIQYNYELELDTSKVISIAVDNMLELSETDAELKQNIIALVEHNIENSSRWDFRKNLKSFLNDVFNSDFRSYEKEYTDFFSDNSAVTAFKEKLNDIENSFLMEVSGHVDSLNCIMKEYDLSAHDFKGGNHSSKIKKLLFTVEKINAGDFSIEGHFNEYEIIEKWLTKDNLTKEHFVSATTRLISHTEIMRNCFLEKYELYRTSVIIKKQFNYAALINQSLNIIKNYLGETGKFLIADVPSFLSEIAKQNSSSFIYEKTGSFYENYLIDEFQDTSKIQWDSFYPLLSESLSSYPEDNTNILVGDVKQSVYSWRGGDWQLLADTVKNNFGSFFEYIPLEDNWRSGKEIVSFNNDFFSVAAEILKEGINDNTIPELHEQTGNLVTNKIYNNIKQHVKKDIYAYVNVKLLSKEYLKEKDFREEAVKKMILQIEELQQSGYQAGDIMILVRKNSEGTYIAEEIIKYSQSENALKNVVYDVISAQALYVSSNKAIQLIISCFKYLINDNDKLAFIEASYIYYLQTKIKNNESVNFNKEDFVTDLEYKISSVKKVYKQKLLHEITDLIILKLELNILPDNVPFLNSFRDLVHEFEQKNPAEIKGFLEYWEDSGIEQNLKIPEKQNAINIITIHKAKGLAADFVFIPFCNWEFYRVNNRIWASCGDKEPFNVLPVWPVNFSGKLTDSLFAKDYYVSKFKQTVESFNMMYVAFTRARKGLFISATENTEGTFNNVEKVLCKVFENKKFIEDLNLSFYEDKNSGFKEYFFGEIKKIDRDFTQTSYLDKYPVFIPEKQVKVKTFFERDKVDVNSESSVHKGIVYHKIFEKITTHKDVDNAVQDLFYQGFITGNDIETYKNEISDILSGDKIKKWFDGSYNVLNEVEIVSKEGYLRRPDRIMENNNEIIVVDYKFGGQENPKYVKQAKEYCRLLDEMGYENINSYIWYVMPGYLLKIDYKTDSIKKIFI